MTTATEGCKLHINEQIESYSYKEACEIVGYDPSAIGPIKKIIYLAYKDGVCKEFENSNDAKKFSKLIEKKSINQDEVSRFHENQIKLKRLTEVTFLNSLRKEFPELSDSQFSCIWSKAWEFCHSLGYEEVALKFKDLYDFIELFRKFESLR